MRTRPAPVAPAPRRARAAVVSVLALAATLVAFTGTAQAATLTITVTSDADAHTPGTLRDAVDQANAGTFDAVVINLPAGTYSLDLCGPDDDTNATGDLDLTQGAPVTIQGAAGLATVTMTCPGQRVIDQHGGALLTLDHLVITGGNAIGSGGGVRALGAVTASDATFTGNHATGTRGADQVCGVSPSTAGSEANGGAIAASGKITSINSFFTANTATGGEGGWSALSCTPDGATHGAVGRGGALATIGSVDIQGGALSQNEAHGGEGGGAQGLPGYRQAGGDAEGGAIFANFTVHLGATNLVDNVAAAGRTQGNARGGAVSSNGSTTVDHAVVSGNHALAADGSIGTCLAGPGGSAAGGALLTSGTLELHHSTLDHNVASGAAGGFTGTSGPCAYRAGIGGGATGGAAHASGSVTLDQSTIDANQATAGDGGGPTCDTCDRVAGGAALGGGVYAYADISATMSTVSTNLARGGQGGPAGGKSYGGGVQANAGASITTTTVRDNIARAGNSANGNTAGTAEGGGLSINAAVTIVGSTVAGNRADNGPGHDADGKGVGGGVAAPTSISATNSTFDGNAATSPGAGAALAATNRPSAEITLFNATITDNIGKWALTTTDLNPAHSVMAGQVGGQLCAWDGLLPGGYNWFDDTTCSGPAPIDEIGTDPQLGPLGDHGGPTPTRVPAATSPLLDKIPTGDCVLDTDQRGDPRPNGPACDIGSVERDGTSGTRYHPLPPTRVLDSRTALGDWNGPLPAGSPRPLAITGPGPANIPPGSTAVVMNVTATNSTTNSFLTTWPTGTPKPVTSNLNFAGGQTIANLVTVRLSPTGLVSFATAVGATDVIADVVGYYDDANTPGDLFTGTNPTRLLDSRTATGGWNSPLTAGTPRSLVVAKPANPLGVPATATAIIANLTVTNPSANSFLTAYPAGTPKPTASNLNFAAGQTIANLTVLRIGSGGAVTFANAIGTTNVVVDIVGYFDPTKGDRFHPIDPTRILDDRFNVGLNGPWGPGQTRALPVAGASGTHIPAGATGLVANLTATNPTTGSFATVFPHGTTRPTASNLNYGPGQTIPNLFTVTLPPNGTIDLYNAVGTTDLVADAVGYYAPT